jgi:hypothetical protein
MESHGQISQPVLRPKGFYSVNDLMVEVFS